MRRTRSACVCASICVRSCALVCVRVRACVRACVHACVWCAFACGVQAVHTTHYTLQAVHTTGCTLHTACCQGEQRTHGLLTRKSGNVFRVGIFLDFASSTTRTEGPHGAGRTCRRAGEIELTPTGVKLNCKKGCIRLVSKLHSVAEELRL